MSNNKGRKILLGILSVIVIGMIFIPAPNALAVEFDDIEIDGVKETYYQELEAHDNYTLYACESDDITFIYIEFSYNISEDSILLQSGNNEYNLTTAMDTSFLKSIKTDFILEFSIVKEVINERIILVVEGLEAHIIIGPPSEDITIPDDGEPEDKDETSSEGGYNIFTLIKDIRDNIPWWFWVISTFFGTIAIISPALISWRVKEHPIQEFDVFTGSAKKKQLEKAGRWLREEVSNIRGYIAHTYKSNSNGIQTIFSELNQSDIRGGRCRMIYKIIELYPDFTITERDLLDREQFDKIYIEHNKRYKYWYRFLKRIPNKTIAMRAHHRLKFYRSAKCPHCGNKIKLYIERVKTQEEEGDTFKINAPFLEGKKLKNPIMICENEECISKKGKKETLVEHIIKRVEKIKFLELKINMEKTTTLLDVEFIRNVTDAGEGPIKKPDVKTNIPITTYLTLKKEEKDKDIVKDSIVIKDAKFTTSRHKSIEEAYKEQASMTEMRNIKAIQLAEAYEDVEGLSKENAELTFVNIRGRAKSFTSAKDNILGIAKDLTDLTNLNKFGHDILYGISRGLNNEIAIEQAIANLHSGEDPKIQQNIETDSLNELLTESRKKIKELEDERLNDPFARQKKRSDMVG